MTYLVAKDSGRSCFASIEISQRTLDNTAARVAVSFTAPTILEDRVAARTNCQKRTGRDSVSAAIVMAAEKG
jgi:hypothetical protein